MNHSQPNFFQSFSSININQNTANIPGQQHPQQPQYGQQPQQAQAVNVVHIDFTRADPVNPNGSGLIDVNLGMLAQSFSKVADFTDHMRSNRKKLMADDAYVSLSNAGDITSGSQKVLDLELTSSDELKFVDGMTDRNSLHNRCVANTTMKEYCYKGHRNTGFGRVEC